MNHNRYGATTSAEFLTMALDGFQLRLDGLQTQLDALRAAVERLTAAEGSQRLLDAPAATRARRAAELPEMPLDAVTTDGRHKPWTAEQRAKMKAFWTPERRAAQGKAMKKLRKSPEFLRKLKRAQKAAAAKPQ